MTPVTATVSGGDSARGTVFVEVDWDTGSGLDDERLLEESLGVTAGTAVAEATGSSVNVGVATTTEVATLVGT
jgi:hypothetical protein